MVSSIFNGCQFFIDFNIKLRKLIRRGQNSKYFIWFNFFFIEQISIAFKKCMRYSQTLNVIILKFIKIRRKKLCESQTFKKQRLQ